MAKGKKSSDNSDNDLSFEDMMKLALNSPHHGRKRYYYRIVFQRLLNNQVISEGNEEYRIMHYEPLTSWQVETAAEQFLVKRGLAFSELNVLAVQDLTEEQYNENQSQEIE